MELLGLVVLGCAAGIPVSFGAANGSEKREGLVFEPRAGLALDLHAPPEDLRPAPVVIVLGGPVGSATAGRQDEALRALCRDLAEQGVAAALCDWRAGLGAGRRDVGEASSWLRAHAEAEGLEPGRIALHASGDGAQPVLDAAMEDHLGATLSLHAGIAVVIEGLRTDLPVLVVSDPGDSPRTRAGMLEFAHQLELCSAPLTRLELQADAARAAIVRFHVDRLGPPPADPSAIGDAARAVEVARLHAERGDVEPFLAFLERAVALGLDDPARVLHDEAIVKVRPLQRVRRWFGDHAKSSRATLVRDSEPGRRITIRGRIVASDGRTPKPGALVDLWQTDASGLYDYEGRGDREPRLYGFAKCDADGRFEVRTIDPGGYPRTMIPAHIHFAVQDGAREQSLEFVFDHDPRMVDSARERARQIGWPIVELVEQPDGTAAGDALIVLR